MIAENEDHATRVIGMVELFLHRAVLGRSSYLTLESDQSVVSAENFRAETLHEGSHMLVQIARVSRTDRVCDSWCTQRKRAIHNTDVHTIKQPIRVLLVALEGLDVFEYLLVYGDLVILRDRDISKEIDNDNVWRFHSEVNSNQRY